MHLIKGTWQWGGFSGVFAEIDSSCIDPLHYLSSRSDFGFEFVEIFLIEKRLIECLQENSASRRVGDSPTRWVGESLGESGSRYSNFLKLIIKLQHFKWTNQPFKRSIWQKRSQRCYVLSQLIYFKGLKKIVSIGNLVDSPTRRVGESF